MYPTSELSSFRQRADANGVTMLRGPRNSRKLAIRQGQAFHEFENSYQDNPSIAGVSWRPEFGLLLNGVRRRKNIMTTDGLPQNDTVLPPVPMPGQFLFEWFFDGVLRSLKPDLCP